MDPTRNGELHPIAINLSEFPIHIQLVSLSEWFAEVLYFFFASNSVKFLARTKKGPFSSFEQ